MSVVTDPNSTVISVLEGEDKGSVYECVAGTVLCPQGGVMASVRNRKEGLMQPVKSPFVICRYLELS